jgi:hypothetical protein
MNLAGVGSQANFVGALITFDELPVDSMRFG